MKVFITILFTVIISNYNPEKIYGKYHIIYNNEFSETDNNDFILNFNSNKYIEKIGNKRFYTKGRFKIVKISDTKKQIILTDKIFRTEMKEEKVVFKSLGSRVFEISDKNSDTIPFREFYSNEFEKTISSGKFVKIK
jgi:hypothetical protein